MTAPSTTRPMRDTPLQVVRGFCMGAADVVPGVSGGTIALTFGIYPDLVAQIRQGARGLGRLARADVSGFVRELRRVDWWFLLPLLAGIGLALVSLAGVISHYLETEPVRTAGVFFGLVIGSIYATVPLVRRWTTPHLAVFAAVAAATFLLLGLGSGQVDDPALPFVFVGGMIAICAMILPGVSGSFLLLMLGLYHYVLDSVDERDLVVIAVFGVGAVIGLAGFSSLLSWALERWEQLMLAGLIGLMAGSLRVLWPWPNGTGAHESTNGTVMAWPEGDVVWPIALAVVAALAVIGLTRVAGTREVR